jgi:hypothetical protein
MKPVCCEWCIKTKIKHINLDSRNKFICSRKPICRKSILLELDIMFKQQCNLKILLLILDLLLLIHCGHHQVHTQKFVLGGGGRPWSDI